MPPRPEWHTCEADDQNAEDVERYEDVVVVEALQHLEAHSDLASGTCWRREDFPCQMECLEI